MNDAHKMLGFFYRAVAVVFIPFLTSCGGGGGGIPNQPPVFNISSPVEETFRQIPVVLFESVVVLDEKNLIPLLPGIRRLGNFKYELTPGELSLFYTTQSLTAGRIYKLVREPDADSFKVSDGSMLIEYVDGADTAVIARDYGLELILDFPSIRTASFRPANFSKLSETMEVLMDDERINLVSLDLIDPSIGPR